MQLPGQCQDGLDSGKEAGAAIRHGLVPWGYRSEASNPVRRHSDGLWNKKTYFSRSESQESRWNRKLHQIGRDVVFKVNSKISINAGMIKRISENQIIALEKTAEALHTEIVQAEVVPRDTGAMQNEKTFVDYSRSAQGIVTIVTEGPDARRLYYHPEYNFQTYENAFAMGEWYRPWLPGGIYEDFAINAFKGFCKRGMR